MIEEISALREKGLEGQWHAEVAKKAVAYSRSLEDRLSRVERVVSDHFGIDLKPIDGFELNRIEKDCAQALLSPKTN